MKVGLVTTWGERCGVAAYSENIVKHLPHIDWRIIGRDEWGEGFRGVPDIADECDVVHFMHQGGLMAGLKPEVVWSCGRTVITRQCIGPEQVFDAATVKTAHVPIPGYVFVPLGIPVVDVSGIYEAHAIQKTAPSTVGCAGIPFDGKGHLEAAQIAHKLGWGVNLVIPDNPHTGPGMARYVREYCEERGVYPIEIETRWLPEEEVVRILARSAVNVFYYTRFANGISGAVRLGLAARRPVIVSRHSQFMDIIPTGCVTVASSIDEVATLVRHHLPTPDELVELWGYDKTAKAYEGIYREVRT